MSIFFRHLYQIFLFVLILIAFFDNWSVYDCVDSGLVYEVKGIIFDAALLDHLHQEPDGLSTAFVDL